MNSIPSNLTKGTKKQEHMKIHNKEETINGNSSINDRCTNDRISRHKDIKTVLVTIFRISKKVEKRVNILSRDKH